MTFQVFMQHLANGISLGSLYALIAIGYTMVYGILRLINFAHGDIFMIATYVAFYGVMLLGMQLWWIAFPAAIIFTYFFGRLVERAAYRPLRNSPRISVLISAIGVSFLIENLAIVIFGGRPKAFPIPPIFNKIIQIGDVSIVSITFFIPAITLALLVGLVYFINQTKTGMAMRAVSKDYEAARLMAIDVDKIISLTFGIGSILAAVGGIMWGLKFPQLVPLMGLMPGLKCFIAAVVGGIGDIRGAVLGGFILGLGEIMLVAFLPALTGYRDAFAFVLLIVILLIKPTGLMGQKLTEKV
ncbi:branched-chain amino acid ABC transporter permease [Thermotalea metallivorans]|uniref:High-affinity branched-chain amino acid transport system permease protein LivH n=1 Tax=Thermotalea metallivorans TaxID=520762 RepID=A0A140LD26_9FIRM|nr:branched-chain amino acid ABC transporter permease [Thermotalea metallivorans]KXG78451.1 High-affinity branched-chain amino acid transport system permease protein LivH [Thermotalea metallivorans]